MDIQRSARNYMRRYPDTWHGVYYSGALRGDVSTSIKFHKRGTLSASTTFTNHKGGDDVLKYAGTYTIAKRIGKWRITKCKLSYVDENNKRMPPPWERFVLVHGTKNRFAVFESIQETIDDIQKSHADINDAQCKIDAHYRKAAGEVRPRQDTKYIILDNGVEQQRR